jgi:RNA polymerase primary sigma factor
MVRLPANVINKISKLNKEISNGEDNQNELLNEMSEFDESLLNYQKTSSLNKITNEDGGEIIDLIVGEEIETNLETLEINDIVKVELKNILSVLDERERMIIESYFGINTEHDGMTLEAIGDKYDLTKERIRQIKEKAIRKLRHNTKKLQSLMNL